MFSFLTNFKNLVKINYKYSIIRELEYIMSLSQRMGSSKMKKGSSLLIIGVFFCLIFFVFTIFCFYMFYHIDQELNELQQDVNTMNIHNSSSVQTEYTQAIDFLENEFTKYREFVEKQQNFLVKLVASIGAGITGLAAFFGIKGRKDISNIIREQYAKQVEEEIVNLIGDQDKVEYLRNCIEREEQAKRKKILFLFQHKENENLMKVYRILEDQRYKVKKVKIHGKIEDREIRHWVEENNIIIYQVGESEFKKEGVETDKNVTYARISRECDGKKVFGILYCEDNKALDRSLYDSCFYINNANYGLTAMERIFSILYF